MRLKVYYLDDEPILLEIFADFFATAEIEVKTFSDPEEAMNAASAEPPHLMVLDHRLPGTTGDRIASQMDPRIPKMLVTGDLDVNCSSHFIAKFPKPYELEKMRAFLNSLLSELKIKAA